MTSNRLIRAFRPFAPGNHSFSGAYLTLVFENIEPSDRFSPSIRIQLNDIHDAKGRQLELNDRMVAYIVSKIAHLFGDRASFDLTLAPGISDGGASTLSFVGGGEIHSWSDLVHAFAPENPDAEARIEKRFYLRQ